MKKKHFRRNKWNIALLILILLGSYYVIKNGFIEVDNINQQSQLNFLTINSIFAGFLYTSLGIMASIIDKKRISRLDKGGYMDNYFNAIYLGLMFHVISTIIALLSIIDLVVNKYEILIIIEQIALIAGITFFIKSVYNILKIIQKVRIDD